MLLRSVRGHIYTRELIERVNMIVAPDQLTHFIVFSDSAAKDTTKLIPGEEVSAPLLSCNSPWFSIVPTS